MNYMTSAWQHAKCRSLDNLHPGFARYMRDIVRQDQIAFSQIMRKHNGHLSGIEFRHVSEERWAFILPNVSGNDEWRIQYFDRDSFTSHACYASMQAAAEELVRDSYTEEDIGALDRIAATDRWRIGSQRLAILQQHNAGKIPWKDAVEQMAQLR